MLRLNTKKAAPGLPNQGETMFQPKPKFLRRMTFAERRRIASRSANPRALGANSQQAHQPMKARANSPMEGCA